MSHGTRGASADRPVPERDARRKSAGAGLASGTSMTSHRLTTDLLIRVVALCIATAGCARPRYAFDPRPPSLPPQSQADSCYQEQRLELAAGRVFWARH